MTCLAAPTLPPLVSPAAPPRPTVCDVLRRYRHPGAPLPLSRAHADHLRHAMQSLADAEMCRTAALGGQAWQCAHCGKKHFQYHACRNRNCPGCGAPERDKWLRRMCEAALPIDYAHVVFTVPHELNPLFEVNARALYGLLMNCAWQTIDCYAQDVHDVRLGGVLMLHTWGQRMTPHFHVHSIITLEGLARDGTRWRGDLSSDRLLGTRTLAARYRDRFLEGLAQRYADGELTLPGPGWTAARFERLIARLGRRRWIVNVQLPPPGCPGPQAAIAYLGRYVQGTAISDDRMISDEHGFVTFRAKDYRLRRRRITVRIPGEEFVRRFALHILPRRFMRVRHCGLFANASAARNLALARGFLGVPTPASPPPPDPAPLDPTIDPLTLRAPFCPDCRTVAMQWIYECAPRVEWIKKRYGFFAARAKGAGFGAKAKKTPAAARATSAAATGPARPTPRPP